MTELQQYTRPEMSADDKANVGREVHNYSKRSRPELVLALSVLLIETARLWAECNEHRAARGFAPMPWEMTKRG